MEVIPPLKLRGGSYEVVEKRYTIKATAMRIKAKSD
jgi:hypothetical protein